MDIWYTYQSVYCYSVFTMKTKYDEKKIEQYFTPTLLCKNNAFDILAWTFDKINNLK